MNQTSLLDDHSNSRLERWYNAPNTRPQPRIVNMTRGGHETKIPACAVILAGLLTTSDAFGSDGVIRNETVWRDTSGNEIWCNGGHMICRDKVFFWVGYDTGPGRWPLRINLYSSRNLTDWSLENTVIRMEGEFAGMGWAGRPALLHCRATGRFTGIVLGFRSKDKYNGHADFAGPSTFPRYN